MQPSINTSQYDAASQYRLDSPVRLDELICLRDSAIFLRGYSELRQLTAWLHEALRCDGDVIDVPDECQRAQLGRWVSGRWVSGRTLANYRNLSICREQQYSRAPYRARCELNISLHYEWKSLMWSPFDEIFRQRVVEAAASTRRVIVILNGGPHHVSQFRDHTHALHFSVADSFAFPQHWFDSYYAATLRLFESFAALPSSNNTCVLWRTSNVGPRLGDAPGERPRKSHHPSAVNGLHQWLNRWATAMASRAGIRVLDLTNVTRRLVPRPNPGQPVAQQSQPRKHRSHKDHEAEDADEGDYYHGYGSSVLLRPFVRRACANCGKGDGSYRGKLW